MGREGRAIAWALVWRHRFALALLLAYLVAFAATKAWILGPDARLRFDPPNGLAAFVVVPFTVAFFYLVGVFTYGLQGDLSARESIFPRHMLTLPVSTRALAGWPMLLGAIASLVLWAAARTFAEVAAGGDARVPWVWPGLLLAAWLTWMQALSWMPYGLRGMRVAAAIAWLVAVDVIVLLAITFRADEAVLIAFLAPQLPLAYLACVYAVTRARRGDVPDWSIRRRSNAASPGSRFRSAARAQFWFEWRQQGWSLPAMVGAVVPWVLLLLFVPGNDSGPMVFGILVLAMLTPPLMAAFAAPALGSFTAFAATRPMASVSLVMAKLTVAATSTGLAWLILAAFTFAALELSGTMAVVSSAMRTFLDFAGPVHAAVVIALTLAAPVASTWKNLVQSLCIGLTGSKWLVRASLLALATMLIAIFPLVTWFTHSDAAQFFAWENLPWIVAGLVCAKLLAAAWVAMRLHAERALSDRALVGGVLVWLATAAALYGVLAWLAASPLYPFYLLAGIAILATPLARVSAAPLALARNRHR